MPTDDRQYLYECSRCGQQMKPKKGDSCVHCSYGSVPCPPVHHRCELDNLYYRRHLFTQGPLASRWTMSMRFSAIVALATR